MTTDVYLEYLCAYIHLNPVRHGLVDAPEAWVSSNYREWIGVRDGMLVDRVFVRERFGPAQAYRAYVEAVMTGEIVPPRGLQSYTFQEAADDARARA